jgi:hypothetical protein
MNRFWLVAGVGIMSGCTTIGSVQDEPLSAGATRIFKADYSSTATAARRAIPDNELKLISDKTSDGRTILIANHKIPPFPNGEYVRVIVEPYRDGSSVRIITRHAGGGEYTEYGEPIFTRIGQRLGEYP